MKRKKSKNVTGIFLFEQHNSIIRYTFGKKINFLNIIKDATNKLKTRFCRQSRGKWNQEFDNTDLKLIYTTTFESCIEYKLREFQLKSIKRIYQITNFLLKATT